MFDTLVAAIGSAEDAAFAEYNDGKRYGEAWPGVVYARRAFLAPLTPITLGHALEIARLVSISSAANVRELWTLDTDDLECADAGEHLHLASPCRWIGEGDDRDCENTRHDHNIDDDAADSLCGDCGRPAHYDYGDERYHHDDPDAPPCFLIRS